MADAFHPVRDETQSFVLLDALLVMRLPFPLATKDLPSRQGHGKPRRPVGCGDSVASSLREGAEVVTSAEVDSPPVLDSGVSGTIISLRERFEAVRRAEIHRVRGRLGNLNSDQEDVLESLSRGLVEKVLQAPMAMMLNAAAANQSAVIVATVRRIFNLPT